MKLEGIDNNTIRLLKRNLAPQLMTNPHFMFYCPNKNKRAKFIEDFLNYYLHHWSKQGTAFVSPKKLALASLTDINGFSYKFSSSGSLNLKLNRGSKRIFAHRETIEDITNVLIPMGIPSKIMLLHCCPVDDGGEIGLLVEEIKNLADAEGFAVSFETFSKTIASYMESLGFEIGYQRQFLDTQFIQTVMTYNVSQKKR